MNGEMFYDVDEEVDADTANQRLAEKLQMSGNPVLESMADQILECHCTQWCNLIRSCYNCIRKERQKIWISRMNAINVLCSSRKAYLITGYLGAVKPEEICNSIDLLRKAFVRLRRKFFKVRDGMLGDHYGIHVSGYKRNRSFVKTHIHALVFLRRKFVLPVKTDIQREWGMSNLYFEAGAVKSGIKTNVHPNNCPPALDIRLVKDEKHKGSGVEALLNYIHGYPNILFDENLAAKYVLAVTDKKVNFYATSGTLHRNVRLQEKEYFINQSSDLVADITNPELYTSQGKRKTRKPKSMWD